jgi:hypothetical protein
MYPFNLIAPQNKICFTDYGHSSGKWCGAKGRVFQTAGIFDSGILFGSGGGIRKNFSSQELNQFTVEHWTNIAETGVLFKAGNLEYGVVQSGPSYFYNLGNGNVTGSVLDPSWNHYALSITGYSYGTGSFLTDFGRYKAHLEGDFLLTGGYFGKGFGFKSAFGSSADGTGASLGISEVVSHTFQVWTYIKSSASLGNPSIRILFPTADFTRTEYIFMGHGNGQASGYFDIGGAGGLCSDVGCFSLDIPTGVWTNISVSINYDGTSKIASGFLNGELRKTGLFALNSFTGNSRKDVEVSVDEDGDIIDEVRFWSGALSSGEIWSNYNSVITSPFGEPNLLHYYRFDSPGEYVGEQRYSFYKNGQLEYTGLFTGIETSLVLNRAILGNKATGNFDEFRLWSGVRTSGEIYAHYNARLTGFSGFRESGLLSYLPFENY